jgi:hypothetical protein
MSSDSCSFGGRSLNALAKACKGIVSKDARIIASGKVRREDFVTGFEKEKVHRRHFSPQKFETLLLRNPF